MTDALRLGPHWVTTLETLTYGVMKMCKYVNNNYKYSIHELLERNMRIMMGAANVVNVRYYAAAAVAASASLLLVSIYIKVMIMRSSIGSNESSNSSTGFFRLTRVH